MANAFYTVAVVAFLLHCRDPTLAETVAAPDPFDPVSKRRFDGRVKKWRRDLHKFDPQSEAERRELEDWQFQQTIFLTNVYSFHDLFQNGLFASGECL